MSNETAEIVQESVGNSVVLDDQGKAMGIRIPTSVKTPVSFLDGIKKYSDVYNDMHKQFEVCTKLYKYNPVVGNAVDILIDFAVTEMKLEPTGNKEFDEIASYWFENVNEDIEIYPAGIQPILWEMALEYFTHGNSFPYDNWKNVDIGSKTYKLPHHITLINPSAIRFDEFAFQIGTPIIYLSYDMNLQSALLKDGRLNRDVAILKRGIPSSILTKIKKNSGIGGIYLDPRFIAHIKRKSKSYQVWGTPYLSRCFSSVALLERLRQLDESISDGLMNIITIFKIGSDAYPADDARLRAFASLVRNPKPTTTIVWGHDVTVEQVGPEGKILSFKDKYADAKQDLHLALGIPSSITLGGSNTDPYASMLHLIERLTVWRKQTGLWAESRLKKIAQYNDFTDVKPKVNWTRMNLANDKDVKNLILAFRDRGLISIQTTLDESGYNYDRETQHRKEETKSADELFAPPAMPFSGNANPNTSPDDPSSKKKTSNTINLKTQTKVAKPGKQK